MEIQFAPKAVEQLSNLPRATQTRIKNKLDFYGKQKDPFVFAKHLVGYNAYRFRIGEYRVVFEVVKKTLYVLLIVKRDSAYRSL